MSAQDAKRFVDLIDSDLQLQEAVKTKRGNLIALAAQRGCTVTQEELHAELRTRWGIEAEGIDFSSSQNAKDDYR